MGLTMMKDIATAVSNESSVRMDELRFQFENVDLNDLYEDDASFDPEELDKAVMQKSIPLFPLDLIVKYIFQQYLMLDFNSREYKVDELEKIFYGYFSVDKDRHVFFIIPNVYFKNYEMFLKYRKYLPSGLFRMEFKEYNDFADFSLLKRFSRTLRYLRRFKIDESQIKRLNELKTFSNYFGLRVGLDQDKSGLKHIMSTIDRVNSLEELSLKNYSSTDQFLPVRLKLRRLRKLTVMGWKTLKAKFQYSFPSLQKLRLCLVSLIPEHIDAIVKIKYLKVLDFDYVDFSECLNFYKPFDMPCLRKILMTHCKVDWTEFNLKIRKRQITSKNVKYSDMKMEEICFKHIADTPRTFFRRFRFLKNLKRLDLFDCFEHFDDGILDSYIKKGHWNDATGTKFLFKDKNGEFPKNISRSLFLDLMTKSNPELKSPKCDARGSSLKEILSISKGQREDIEIKTYKKDN